MSFRQRIAALAVPFLLLALSACATGFPAQVQRFSAMPAPQGQSFFVQPADPDNRGGLEFSRYADHVRRNLIALGYVEAPSAEAASFVVEIDYGVDDGRERIVASPSPWSYGPGFRPFYSRWGYFGPRRHPFYWGWYDPWFDDPFGYDLRSYTVYTSFFDMEIRRTADGQALFEGVAQARSRTDELPVLVPNLIEAMFTGFPGNSGETVRITVAPERERR